MKATEPAYVTIDEYIATFPADVQEKLEMIRRTIREAVPDAEEAISYKIPAFKLNGTYFIYFAGFKNHLSVYPAPVGEAAFQEELQAYRSGKATARFPLDRPIPVDLICKIVHFRAQEALERVARRKKNRRTATEGAAAPTPAQEA
jgi:uncharacterized protein YdhG (YjbR/CyaY superfamily)